MPTRWIRVVPASALADGLKAIRRDAGVPEAFPADVLAEAQAAARTPVPERERVEIPFVTIDPPGARDLDQMLHIERRGDGHRVRYAIADPGVFITPGGALGRGTPPPGGGGPGGRWGTAAGGVFITPGGARARDTHARGVTVSAPALRVPLPPPVLSEGAASLLPGQWRPAVLWTLDLDAAGELVATTL